MPGPLTEKDKKNLADRREELSSAAMKANYAQKRRSASKKSPVGVFFIFLILVAALLVAQKLGFLDRWLRPGQ